MKREHAFWLLMVVGTLGAMAIGAELFVRGAVDDGMQYDLEMWKYTRDLKQVAADPLIGHAHRPNSAARLMGVDVRINSKGLREREIPYERTGGTLRILMLGDSLTEGWGVAFDDTFSKRIERLYAARGIAAEVINAGVGNYNTVMEANYFLAEGRKFRPDIVVLNYFPNDAEGIPLHVSPSPLLRFCYACVFLFGRGDLLLREASLRPDWKAYYLDLYRDGRAPGWRDAKAAIGALAAYARAHDMKLLITHLPDLHQLDPYRFEGITDLVRDAAQANGAYFLDVLPELKSEPPSRLWVSPSDPHPNGYANALIANALFRKLATME
jgi:lysophospholipase L1-like esterase